MTPDVSPPSTDAIRADQFMRERDSAIDTVRALKRELADTRAVGAVAQSNLRQLSTEIARETLAADRGMSVEDWERTRFKGSP